MRVTDIRTICLVVAAALPLAMSGCNRVVPAGEVGDSETAAELAKKLGLSDDGGGAVEKKPTPEATGTRTIRGQFILDGDAPAAVSINSLVTKDTAVCRPDNMDVFSKQFRVGPNKGIRDIAIYLRNDKIKFAEGVDVPPEAQDLLAAELDPNDKNNQVVFDQKMCVFTQHVFAVQVGKTMNITNSDPIGHDANAGAIGLGGSIVANGAMLFTVKKSKKIPTSVTCGSHPWMLGWILPRDNGYFAVTGDDGKFEIKNVPTGIQLDLMVWHEVANGGGVQATVQIDDGTNKSSVTSKKGRLIFTLSDGNQDVDFGEIKISPDAFKF